MITGFSYGSASFSFSLLTLIAYSLSGGGMRNTQLKFPSQAIGESNTAAGDLVP